MSGAALITDASSGIGPVHADRLLKRAHASILVACARPGAPSARLAQDTGLGIGIPAVNLTDAAAPRRAKVRLAMTPDLLRDQSVARCRA